MSRKARTSLAALLSFCLGSLLSYAQETTPSPTPASAGQSAPASQGAGTNSETAYKSSTVLKYTTRLVVVDVIATDHKGNPVTNLEKQDFTLLEDGKDQNIEVFSFQAPGEAGKAASPRSFSKLPANVITNVPQYDVTRALTVLLLDGLNTQTSNQAFARDQMLKFLEKLPADQPIAVYALGTKLRLLQDFTSDPALLKNAVMAMQSHGSPVLTNPAGAGGDTGPYAAAFMAAVAETAPALAAQMQQFEQDSTTMQTDLRVQLTLAAFSALGRALAGYPGRKNLIWLSQSFPLSILATAITSGNGTAVPNQRTEMNNRDYSMESARTASLLTDAQVAVYPVDVGALVGNQVYSSLSNTDGNGNYLGRTMSGRSAGGMGAANDELNRTSVEQLGSHSSMNDLADRTGGKAFYNRNDVEAAIQKTLDDGSTYYTLAYHPQNKDWNGNFRKISLKLRQSGIKLRYRAGYYAIDPQSFEKMTQQRRNAEFGQALNLDFPISTAISFQARVFPPSEQTKGKVVVNFGIDPHSILFETEADGQHAEVDYALAAYSKKGEAVKLEGHTLKTALPPDAFQKVMSSYLPCQLQVELPPGEYVLRLGVRDDRTGLLGTVNTTLTVQQPAH